MRSSLILGVSLLVAASFIIQPCKSHEEECGNLGPGINACKCGEIVVKAAKVQKPLFYASPEAINEAAVAREAVGSLASFSKYKPYSGAFSSSSSSSIGGSSFSSSSSSSSAGLFGRLSGVKKAYLPFSSVSGRVGSNCGCGKGSESLEVRDLLASNVDGKIVPSFPPIGDLCYPTPRSSKFQVTTKVTPAYPGKIKCVPPIPYEICVQVLNGQINEAGLRKLGFVTNGESVEYISNVARNTQNKYGNIGKYKSSAYGYGSYAGSSASSSASSSAHGYGSNVGYGLHADSSASSSADSSVYGYGNRGSYAGSSASSSAYGRGGYAGYGSYSGSGASSSAYGSNAGYGSYSGSGASSTAYGSLAGYGSYAGSGASSAASSRIYGSAASYKSGCDSDFGDDIEFPEDYSYPRLPADPVSLTLAYKNLFPRTVYYNRKTFVPEDKLSFGHRTIPIESVPRKKVPDVPEEKLQILDKPVVELKPVSPVPVTVGVYDEHEEAKLAELEAIERERINRQEIVERQQENVITYGDLGYAPINQVSVEKSFAGSVGVFNAEDDTEPNCGPVGPPDPDYVPGSVLIDRELVENEGEVDVDAQANVDGSKLYVRHYAGEESSDEEDDNEDSTSGIFARLKSVTQKFGSPCGAVV